MDEIRFLADDMVGRLARWLRVLGYDTASAGSMSDTEVAALARREGRTVLTRHAALAERFPDLDVFVIDDENPWMQLSRVVAHFRLDTESGLFFTRCSVCNGLLEKIDKVRYRERIPPKSYAAFADFWRCPGCGRIYWAGTHVERMREQLGRLREGDNAGRNGRP
jgi:uncharacterized protein with PIN domain